MIGTPSLPNGWVECNGQTINDSTSPYNGKSVPNLNSNKRFLRGSTSSGASGGEDTHTLTVEEIPFHSHNTHPIYPENPGTHGSGNLIRWSTSLSSNWGSKEKLWQSISDSTGGNQPHNNLPKYFEIVWIIRIK